MRVHCCSLLAAKSDSFPAIDSAMQTTLNVLREIDTHKAFCAGFGVSLEELDATEESIETTAYGCYLMDIGLKGDTMKLLIVLLACLLGYGEVGLRLKTAELEGNPYRRWIEDYSGPHYQGAVRAGLELIEERAQADPPSSARLKEWLMVWDQCTRLETAFWAMGLNAAQADQ
ncbi:unnamed protein product [Mycena citricolor]|uniref:Thiaminase-2/PQQC domain-containing protein n=1 Tax=Mycena citricolor TaxID=2018698 RepID=A0AAD2GV07_9AGAR|nr:unnamed protein product [Mycena citricolor]